MAFAANGIMCPVAQDGIRASECAAAGFARAHVRRAAAHKGQQQEMAQCHVSREPRQDLPFMFTSHHTSLDEVHPRFRH